MSRPVRALRFAWLQSLMLLALAAGVPSAAFAQFTLLRTSSPIYYTDAPTITGMYVSYEVRNTSATNYADIWVGIGSFTGGVVSLAANEDGQVHLGPMAPGQTKMAYFFLNASGTTGVAQGHTITLYSGPPPTGPVTSGTFSFSSVQGTISAGANKVNTVVTGPDPASIGGIVTVTVNGETGSIGSPPQLSFNPATFSNWPANTFELFSTTITLTGSGSNSGVITDSLFFTLGYDANYSAVYRFRITAVTNTTTPISPVSFIQSGANMKHTNSVNFNTLTPIPVPQNFLRLTKQASPNRFLIGGTTTYTVPIHNSGPNDVEHDFLADVMPAGATYVPGSSTFNGAAIADPTVAGQALSWNRIFAHPAITTSNVTYQAVIPAMAGTHINSMIGRIGALVQIDTTLATNDNFPGKASVYVEGSNITITKTASPSPATLLQPLTYTLVISNPGPDTARTATVLDTLPANVTFVSVTTTTGTATYSGGVVSANLGNRAVGTSDTIRIVVTPTALGAVTNTARVASTTPDPSPAGNASTVSTTVNAPNLVADKRHTAGFTVGQNGSYTIVVRNTGAAATVGATTVTDTLPTGLSFVSGSGAGWTFVQNGQTVTATLAASVASGDSSSLALTVAVGAPAFPSVTNAAMARTTSEADSSNNRDTDVTAITGIPDLTMDKRHTAAFTVGQNGVYTLVATNSGTATTGGFVTVTDTLPAGLSYVSASGAGWTFVQNGQTVTATHAAALVAGDSASFTLTASVAPGAFPSVTNDAMTRTPGEPDSTNNRDTDVTAFTGVPDLTLDKRHTTAFKHGQNGTWTLVVINIGTIATTGATTVTDTLPSGITFVSGVGAGWSVTESGGIVTSTLAGAIAAGDSAKFDLTVSVDASAVPGVTNSAYAATTGDLDSGNDGDSDATSVTGTPDVTLDKRHATAFEHGQNGTWTLVVTNTGSGATTGATSVTDTLPAGITFVNGAGAGWTVTESGGVVTATFAGAIAAGDSASFAITVSVGATAFPSVTNSATAATPDDLGSGNDGDSDVTAVGGAPDLALDKRHTAHFEIGTPGVWTIVATNLGTGVTTGVIAVSDTLPPGITFVSGAGAGWTITELGGIVSGTHPGPIAAGDSASFMLTVNSSLVARPIAVNAASVSTIRDLDAANDRDVDPTFVLTIPDMMIDKRHTADFVDGQNGTYTIVVTNISSGPSVGTITVTDTLPAGLGFVSASGAGWSIFEINGVVVGTYNASIAPFDSTNFTVTVAAGQAAVPGVVNAAELSGGSDTWPGNNRDLDPTVVAGIADLTLDKRHVADFTHGQNGAWTFVVTNLRTGSTSAAIAVTDTLPAGVTFVSGAGAGWSVTASGGIVTATSVGPIAAGDSSVFTITVLAGASAVPAVVNAAEVSGGSDIDPDNNRDVDTTAVLGVHDLTLDKRHTAAFSAGQPGMWTIVVTNAGTAATTAAITVLDTLPAGVTFASGAGAGWSIVESGGIVLATNPGPIAAGDSASLVLTVNVTPAALPGVTNRAIASTPGDLDAANDSDSDSTAVGGAPDLALVKRHVASFTIGQPASYTIVVTNLGNAPTSGAITVLDTLPAGLGYAGANGAGFGFGFAAGVLTATHAGPIAPGDSVSFQLDVTVSVPALPGVTNAAVVSTAFDLDPSNDRGTNPTIVNGLPDLALDKRHTGPFTVGQNADWLFVVTNNGTAANTGNITVTDTLPASVTFIAGLSAGWTITASGPIITATNTGTITDGDSSSFGITVLVLGSAVPSVTNQATVRTAGDASPGNDTDTDVASVTGTDLSLDKRHTGSFTVGGTGTYTFVVLNSGSAPTSGTITVRDTLPAGLTYVAANGTDWTVGVSGAVVTATHANSLANGDSASFTLVVAIGAAALPSVTNSAVASTPGDLDGANDRDTDQTAVTGIGVLVVEKTAAPLLVEIGDVVDYAVTVRNIGNGPITGVTVSDVMPHGLRYRGGTARMNGTPLADPSGAPGPQLNFALGTLTAGTSAVLTYRVDIGAGAELGTGVNFAIAAGDSTAGLVVSNTAAVRIQIRGGVFGDEGIIAGKVYMQTDCAPDGSQGAEELGVPGVRVYLEDGTYAITDVEGKYHFNHVRPRLHVVRIDSATLPAGARMLKATQRHAGDGLSRFVDLVKGELHRADFTEASNSPAVLAVVQQRRVQGEIIDPADPGTGHGGAAAAEIGTRRKSLLVLGVIDAGIGRRSLTDAQVRGQRDGFGDALDDLSADGDEGRLFGRARGAVFAKGPLTDSTSFTLRYDSQRDPQRRLFRDLRPFEGYDALGDASVHGWDAQSASRLYLRLERGASFAMLGDYNTPASPARTLGAFTRSLNGGVAGLVLGPLKWHAWASEGRQRQIIDELPGQGVSGPYALSRGDGTLGSETVEIVTRDRNQPTRIVRRQTQLRNVDYTLEPFTGRLLFRRPVPSIDADLNPVSIRVTYEAETGGDKFRVYGTDARWTPVTRLSVGAAVARDEDPFAPRSVVSANALLELAKGITVAGEIARSDSGGTIGDGVKSGEAGRVELAVSDVRFNGRLYALRTGTGFDNPSAGVIPGREELGLTARVAVESHTSVFVSALRSKDLATGGHRDGAEAGIAYVIAERYTAEAAYRWARERNVPASPVTALVLPIEMSSVRGKLLAQLPARWNTSVFGEVEQNLETTDQRRFAFGGDTRLWAKTRAYARHENITSFAGPWALNSGQQQATTVIGLSSEALGDGQVFSEYRLRDAFAGREAHAAIGLRNRWRVAPGVRLDGAFERVTILKGGSGEATAVAGGIEYMRDPLWRGTGRLEMRTQSGLQRWLTSAGITRKLSRDWAALGRTTWLMVPPEDRIDARSQVGVAYRQTDHNVWNGLARYENRLEKTGGPASYRKVANIVSAHANAQASPPLNLSGQLAAKWAEDDRNGLTGSTTAQLVAARALYDVSQRVDLGMTARGLRSGGTQFGLGAEIGFLAIKNLRLAAGYNVLGFRDEDLSGADRTDHGPYLNFGYKFDESHFGHTPQGGGR